jgi:hypothetical protein
VSGRLICGNALTGRERISASAGTRIRDYG